MGVKLRQLDEDAFGPLPEYSFQKYTGITQLFGGIVASFSLFHVITSLFSGFV
jgi:hypothetical protein